MPGSPGLLNQYCERRTRLPGFFLLRAMIASLAGPFVALAIRAKRVPIHGCSLVGWAKAKARRFTTAETLVRRAHHGCCSFHRYPLVGTAHERLSLCWRSCQRP